MNTPADYLNSTQTDSIRHRHASILGSDTLGNLEFEKLFTFYSSIALMFSVYSQNNLYYIFTQPFSGNNNPVGTPTAVGSFQNFNPYLATVNMFDDFSTILALPIKAVGTAYNIILEYFDDTGSTTIVNIPNCYSGLFSVVPIPSTNNFFILAQMYNKQLMSVKKLSLQDNKLVEWYKLDKIFSENDLPTFVLNAASSGAFNLVWSYLDSQGIFAQSYQSDGSLFGQEVTIQSTPKNFITYTQTDGSYVIAWTDLIACYAQMLQFGGTYNGNQIQISNDINGALENIKILDSDQFAVTMKQEDIIISKMFSSTGTIIAEPVPCSLIGYIGSQCLVYNSDADTVIDSGMSQYISAYLQENGNLVIKSLSNITLTDSIEWHNCNKLTLISQNNIILTSSAYITTSGALEMKAGIENTEGKGTVVFQGNGAQIDTEGDLGVVVIHYNPDKGKEKHKYHNPNNFYYKIASGKPTTVYMLINSMQDLQDIYYFLSGNYALSQDILMTYSEGLAFFPITIFSKKYNEQTGFSGFFDGNGYKIENLEINQAASNDIGMFSRCEGTPMKLVRISNIIFEGCKLTGNYRVGVICGSAQYIEIKNVTMRNCVVEGTDYIGGAVGSAILSKLSDISLENLQLSPSSLHKGSLAGGALMNTLQDCSGSENSQLVGTYLERNEFEQCLG